ncbi:hypothetical protein AN639_00780 [Candidatus Epulonipiscium fishelsonii]|uniref:Uncharacterized protein n=1 Tax=Candidatus Epulonipiscium fishelsonii TaxID=77094 RepID=A0ACC8X7I3_9FIRM|nr:hypothetical protein AN396_12375 [Epulopiscium sp. SCG-B11WGA-EpuloA1]ONI41332.1 hypothetical protein AN639_00780 [Epulopiscium sp. SCG-B05WGA-EpuloA1]
MINEAVYQNYVNILEEELVPAMGCTEPIAIAYAAAKMKEILGAQPNKVVVNCSRNIIKNALCVTVPNSGNLVGIEASAIMGIVAGNSEKELEVISEVSKSDIEIATKLLNSNYCKVELLDTIVCLHLVVEGYLDNQFASVEIRDTHTNVVKIIKNDEILFETKESNDKYLGVLCDRTTLNVKDIFKFANTVNIDDIKELIKTQIEYNLQMVEEGLTGNYGLGIGKVLLEGDTCINTKMKAYTAAASEARMSGSALPVITNSGSGNQGMTTSVPIIIYAKEYNICEEQLYRALVFANLMTIHQRSLIGRLSAFCGAVNAACASGAAITYLCGGEVEKINMTITNTLANISGIVCDGAKASCAAKIASSLDGALMGHKLAMAGQCYCAYTGILKGTIEDTIAAVGRLGKDGMHKTDHEILDIMLGN